MVSSSILRLKIKRYLLEIVVKNGRKHITCILYKRQHIALEHDTYLYLVLGLVYPLFITFFTGFGESICLSYDYIIFSP